MIEEFLCIIFLVSFIVFGGVILLRLTFDIRLLNIIYRIIKNNPKKHQVILLTIISLFNAMICYELFFLYVGQKETFVLSKSLLSFYEKYTSIIHYPFLQVLVPIAFIAVTAIIVVKLLLKFPYLTIPFYILYISTFFFIFSFIERWPLILSNL